ncbi:MAG: hypothetical protein HFI63_00810 [Lachnospiraceae bacterium]|nr:hypothetical protein [Lachnospiraceae bacterium]
MQGIKIDFNDKYNYSLTQLDTESLVMSQYWSLAPLKSQEVYFLQSVPDEVVSLPFVIEFTIGDSETIYRYIQK